jgi:ornithine carbamoyltransferase
MLMARHFISLAELSADEVIGLLDLSEDLKTGKRERKVFRPLDGKTLALIFEKPSLRTRMTFETGMFQLGGHAIYYHTRLGQRETVPDVARNLTRWVDAIAARTYSHQSLLELAQYSSVPVINALSDKSHPCQILADALALREHKGELEGLKVVFVGDGNNVLASWVEFATRVPIELTLVCPEGYEPEPDIRALGEQRALAKFAITHDVKTGVAGADAVYTDVWASMGQEEEEAIRVKAFAAYQVNSALMALAKPDAVFMHCLPAHRGAEVTDDVIDSPQSIVFDQAENRLHVQKAILVTLMTT